MDQNGRWSTLFRKTSLIKSYIPFKPGSIFLLLEKYQAHLYIGRQQNVGFNEKHSVANVLLWYVVCESCSCYNAYSHLLRKKMLL